jgi:hypothetical protein
MKKIILSTILVLFYSNIVLAEKVECELLSPMQKAIYKAYCQAEAKKKQNISTSTNNSSTVSNIKEKTGGLFKKLKVNTDSKLFKTGKYKEKQ